jgi:hypothetical protein
MRSTSLLASAVALTALGLISTTPAMAAYINIDAASVPGQITMVAGDFEFGINVNGNTTSGLGNGTSATIAASSGPMTFTGSWIDLGASTPGSFAQISGSDELIYTVSTGGPGGTISGEFCSNPTVCTIPVGAAVINVGEGPNSFGQPFLTATWQSVAVPEPAGMLVFSMALGGLLMLRRQQGV